VPLALQVSLVFIFSVSPPPPPPRPTNITDTSEGEERKDQRLIIENDEITKLEENEE
jgi:hypothetical protein